MLMKPARHRLGKRKQKEMHMMARRAFALLRALIIAPAFISLWMYFVPRWVAGAHAFDSPRPLGWIVVAIGAAIGLPCVWQFAWRGLGTPAPFDPPRRLVISGPYRWVRNPMYIGAGLAFIGEGVVYPNLTWLMLAMVAGLFIFVTFFVIGYEEPTLRRTFGSDYEAYCRQVRRWIPRLRPWYSEARLD
jgi:protein-S-isoprenylcysteine O-methyltransferase Ste14